MTNFVETFRTASQGLSAMPAVRQVLMLVGLAASIALGFSVVLWSQEPNFRPLFSQVDHADMAGVLDALDRAHIRYKLDDASNMVMVPSGKIYKARLTLASSGLPKNTATGFEMLNGDQGITTSRFMETARYRHALEGELARTIANIDGVRDARVHLAIPRQSSFLENDEKPSASVLVNLAGGAHIDHASVGAISRLVASSIPGLESENVTVVDQTGRLLSAEADNDHFAQTKDQFNHKNQYETLLEHRIEAIVAPLIGVAKVRAKVTADMDFTHIEQTQENFNQAQPVIRSEEILDERKGNGSAADEVGGVPGALANSPSDNKGVTMTTNAESKKESTAGMMSTRQHTTRNYEVGKTISHTLIPSGVLKRLSIAVVVDNKAAVAEDGTITRTPLNAGEVAQITALVKNAVGYDDKRGDTISVVNSSFAPGQVIEPVQPTPLLEQAWVWSAAKNAFGGVFVLLLVFFVIRPVMRTLAEKGKVVDDMQLQQANQQQNHMLGYPMMQGGAMTGQMAMPMASANQANPVMLQNGQQGMQQAIPVEQGWEHVRQLAQQDPKKMAQVMKGWVG